MTRAPLFASLGCVTARGVGADAVAAALRGGGFPLDSGHSSGRWSSRKYGVGLVEDLQRLAAERLSGLDLRRLDRVALLALLAARDALGSEPLPAAPERTALVLSSTHGSIGFSAEYHEGAVRRGAAGLSALLFSSSLLSSAAGALALAVGIRGPVHTLSCGATACADALEAATLLLECGDADAVLCVGAEMFHPLCLDAYDALFRLHARFGRRADPVRAFRFTEGGVAFLLVKDGEGPGSGGVRRPLGALLGVSGATFGAWSEPLEERLEAAWRQAGLSPREADLFVSASNHSFLDRLERDALLRAGAVPRRKTLPLKTVTGEGFAFTSFLQAAAALLTLGPGETALVQSLHFDGAAATVALQATVPE